MRKRISIFKEFAGRHHRRPFAERLIEVVDDRPTGEVLLDEALKLMKAEQQPQTATNGGVLGGFRPPRSVTRFSNAIVAAVQGKTPDATPSSSTTSTANEGAPSRQSVASWIDLLSGRNLY